MRKSLLKAFICVTAVLAIIGLTMIGQHIQATQISMRFPSSSQRLPPQRAETTVAPTETQTETTTEATTEKVTEKVTEPTTAKPKPTQTTESKEPVETPHDNHDTTKTGKQRRPVFSLTVQTARRYSLERLEVDLVQRKSPARWRSFNSGKT